MSNEQAISNLKSLKAEFDAVAEKEGVIYAALAYWAQKATDALEAGDTAKAHRLVQAIENFCDAPELEKVQEVKRLLSPRR